MFHVLSWLAVYSGLLFGLNRAVGPFRERRWFKVLFFPGTLLAALVQAVPARLCVAPSFEVSLLGEGRPAFDFKEGRVPCLGGALFLLLSQALLYTIWLILAGELDLVACLDAGGLNLPAFHLRDFLQGRSGIRSGDYFERLGIVLRVSALHPLIALPVLYLALGTFASLRLDGKESLWALVVLSFLAALAEVGESFGVGFSFLGRGWWARALYSSQWWAAFSLYLTLAGLCLGAYLFLRLLLEGAGLARGLFPGKRRRPRKAGDRARARA